MANMDDDTDLEARTRALENQPRLLRADKVKAVLLQMGVRYNAGEARNFVLTELGL